MIKKLSFILAMLMLFNLIVPSAVPIAEILSEEVSNMEFERMRDNQRKTYVRELDPERELQKKSRASNNQKEKSIDLMQLKNKISVDDETIEVLTKIYPDIQEISTMLNKIDRFANRNNISEEEKEKLIIGLKEGKTLDEVLSKHIKENKKAETEEILDNAEGEAAAATKSILASREPDYNKYSKEYTAPFSIDKNNELINPSDGSLTYKYPIVSLQGTNGLDVNLEAVYNSRDAVIWGITGSTTFTERNNKLGVGWSWNLPVIEIDEEYDYRNPTKYLHLGDGAVYEIYEDLYEDDSNLVKYRSMDMQLLLDRRNFSNSEMSSRYVLKEKDGKQTYFGRDGRLLGIVDRYGNTITFEHTIIDDHPVVNRIIDTLGRTVRISYWDDEVLVRAPGGKRTDIWLERIRHDGRTYGKTALETIIDPIGRRTEISYITEKIWFSETHKTRFDDYDIEVNLYDVTYPTGIRTDFEYELTTENLGRYGAIERNRILSRLDYNRSERKRYNLNDYSYSRNNSTGYPRYDNPRRLPDDFTYYTYVENQDGTEVDYTFNNEHLVIEQTVSDSRYILSETTYDYNTRINRLPTRIVKREYTRGSNDYFRTSVRYTYDEYSNIISKIDERGNETRYEYFYNYYNLPSRIEKYENRKLKSEIDYYLYRPGRLDIGEEVINNIVDGVDKSITTTYNYDSYGNITEKKIMGTEGTTKEKYQYYEDAYVSKVTITDENNSISYVEETDYDFNTGLVASSTDGRGNKTSYEYDILGRLVKTINPDRTQETISYDDEQNQTTVTDANNYVTKLSYDPLGNHIYTEQNINGRMILTEEKGYNLLSQLEWVKDANGNRTRYYYDSLGRIEDITNPDNTGSWISYEDSERLEEYSDEERRRSYSKYDEVGNIVEQGRTNGSRKEINYSSYDYNNNLVSYTDNEGNTTDYKYDQLGNLIEVKNAAGEKIRYEYNHLGNVTKMITAEGSITENKYDSSGRLIKEIDPIGKVREITYDLAGNIIKETESLAGQTITTTYKYNSKNQQIEKVDGEGMTTYTYDNAGNLIEISDRNGTVVNTYNPEGTLEEIIQPDGKSISYRYDDNGNIIETIDHYGEITENTYDSRNRLKTVKQQGKTTEYEYLKNGQVKKVKYPTGASIQYSYDGVGNLTGLINTGTDGQTIGKYEYTYDREGNQLTKEEHGKLSNYTYDSLSRVKTVDEEDGLTTYKYDRNGNIREKEIFHSPSSIYRVKDQLGTKIIPNIKSHKVTYIYDNSNKLITSHEEIENQARSLMRAQQISSLTINSSARELEKGEAIELELSGIYIDGSRIEDELLEEATWTTDNPNLELKSNKGKAIKAVYLGNEEEWVIIKANLNEETAQIRLKVKFIETEQPIEEPIEEEEPVEEIPEKLPVEDETTEDNGATEKRSEDTTEEPIEEPVIKEEYDDKDVASLYNSHIIQSANIGRLVELEQMVETSDLEDDFPEEIEEEKDIEEIEDVEDEDGLEEPIRKK